MSAFVHNEQIVERHCSLLANTFVAHPTAETAQNAPSMSSEASGQQPASLPDASVQCDIWKVIPVYRNPTFDFHTKTSLACKSAHHYHPVHSRGALHLRPAGPSTSSYFMADVPLRCCCSASNTGRDLCPLRRDLRTSPQLLPDRALRTRA